MMDSQSISNFIASGHYNIAYDCLDKHVDPTPQRKNWALIFVKEDISGNLSREKYSFRDFVESTNRFANALIERGYQKGDRFLIYLQNCPEFITVFLGGMKAGLIPIPVSPLLTESELQFMQEDSQARFIVCEERLQNLSIKNILIQNSGDDSLSFYLKSSSEKFKVEMTDANAPAYWLYTSGTQGEPKAVIHAHRSIPAHDSRVYYWQNFQDHDVIFNTSSLNWSYALTAGFLDIWRQGGSVLVYKGQPRPELLHQIVHDNAVSVFMSVPGIYRRLTDYLERKDCGFEPLRVCLSAGEKLSDDLVERFIKSTALEIYEGLGMTEHSIYLCQPFGKKNIPGSCGWSFAASKVAILHEDLTECKPNEVGILASHKSCPGLMLGYHNRPEEESRVFKEEWFLSGDLAKRDEEGYFYFIGRRDDVLTVGGYRISPIEVEAVVNCHPYVLESAVVQKKISSEKNIIKAYVVLKSDCVIKESLEEIQMSLISQAAQCLASYKIPREIEFCESLPKTRNGKIKRKNLVQNNI